MSTALRLLTPSLSAIIIALPLRADIAAKPTFALQGIHCPYQLELGDLNNDGKPDLAVASWVRVPAKREKYDPERHRVFIFFQKDGIFAMPPDREIKLRFPWGMCSGDFDDDGKTDLAVKESGRVMHLFLGAEDLAIAHTSTNINDSSRYVNVGRLSRGGKLDFLSGPVWRKWYGGDKVVAGYCYGPRENDNRDSRIADLDQDGNSDLVFVGGGTIRLYYGPLTTQIVRPDELSQLIEITPPMPPRSAKIADLNGDGRPDLVAALKGAKPDERSVVIYHQNAPVGFDAETSPSVEIRGVFGEINTADLNRDGLPDLIASDSVRRQVHVFMQREGKTLGTGSGDAYQTIRVSNHDTAVGDLNGDGLPDLVVSDGRSNIRFYLNDGKGFPDRAPAKAMPVAQTTAPRPRREPQPRLKPAEPALPAPEIKLDLPPPQPGPDYEDPYRMPFYTGAILPTPQKVTYKDDFFPLRSAGLILGDGLEGDGPYVRELRDRIERYGGTLLAAKSLDAKCDTLIILGDTDAARPFLGTHRVPDREQGCLVLSVAADGERVVVLKGHDRLGLLWAISSFNQLVHVRDGAPHVRAADVFDYPELPNRGFIGGRWVDGATYSIAFKINKPVFQSGLVDYSIRNRRERGEAWRNPIPESVKEELKTLGSRLSPFGIQWYAGHNPIACEKKIRSADEGDFKVVLGWASAAAEQGGNLCLKYDDSRFPISPEDMETFGSGREADTHLLTRLHRELRKQYPEAKVLFCPPFYWGPSAQTMYPEPRDEYLYALGKLPEGIEIFWTGPRVKSGKVTPEMVAWITERIQRKPVYWQNAFGMPHMYLYHYVTDPVRVYQEWFYDGFFQQMDTYMFNCGMPAYAAAAATTSDYCWNPKAYDAERSVKEAATKLVGPETYAALVALNHALSYFDPFGLRRTPGAAKKLPEMAKKLAAVNAVWKEVERRNVNAVRTWTSMERHVGQVNRFYERLRRSPDLSAYRKDAGESQARAKKEVGLSDKTDVFLSAYDFLGGCGPKHYATRCEKRLATWVYGRRSSNPHMEATFRVDPFPPSSDYALIVSAQDDDAEAKCHIRIWVNETMIFEGENPFVRLGWSRHTFRIPAASLKRQSRLRIENAEDTSRAGGPPFFMLNYAVVRRGK